MLPAEDDPHIEHHATGEDGVVRPMTISDLLRPTRDDSEPIEFKLEWSWDNLRILVEDYCNELQESNEEPNIEELVYWIAQNTINEIQTNCPVCAVENEIFTDIDFMFE